MILSSRPVSAVLSAIVYLASLFVSPDILINQRGCYHDITVQAFDQLKFQGYLEKNITSSNTCSFHNTKPDSWDISFTVWNQSQIVLDIIELAVRSIKDSSNIRLSILHNLLFPFHSFW